MTDAIYSGEFRKPRLLEDDVIDGIRYVITNMGGYPCAYVEVPEGHPFCRTQTDDLDERVGCHGGLTYIECKAPYALNAPENHNLWLGWDYAHWCDFVKYPEFDSSGHRYTLEEIREDVGSVIAQIRNAACEEKGDECDGERGKPVG